MVEKIIDFVKEYYPEATEEQLREVIAKHIEYGTIAAPQDKDGEFYGVAVWHIKGFTAFVEAVVVNPKYQRGKILKLLVAQGWTRFKWLKYIAFERRFKNNDRGLRIYRITQFF